MAYQTSIICDVCHKKIMYSGRMTKKALDENARNIRWWVGKVRGKDVAYCEHCKEYFADVLED